MTRVTRRRSLAAVWTAALVAATMVSAQNPRDLHNRGTETFDMRVVASGLGNPWEMIWGPDGFLWITERTAFRVTRLDPVTGSTKVALVLNDVYQSVVQDGLLGMTLHPDLLKARGRDYVFLAYTYDRDPGSGVTLRLRVRRFTYDTKAETLGAGVDVIDDLPAHNDHGAGRLAIGPDGKLYLTRGDLGGNFLANYCNAIHSQDLPSAAAIGARDWSSYQGKVLRLELDGSIPSDNPTIAGVRSHIYAFGFRNPQGLVFGPGGLLYASDHGPSSDDEIDLITAGGNYGWPLVAGHKDDRGYVYANWSASAPTQCSDLKFDNLNPPTSVPQAKESAWNDSNFVAPLATFFTVPPGYPFATSGNATVAPAGIDIYTAGAIPTWANSVLLAGMRTGTMYRMKLSADGKTVVGAPLEYFKSTNRYRDVTIGPDGRRIFLATDSFGATSDAKGTRTETLSHPGAVLEFTYRGPGATSRP